MPVAAIASSPALHTSALLLNQFVDEQSGALPVVE